MNPAFDAYHLWLGIPPEEQPPNHYRLLGLRVRESDDEVIDIAALRLSAHLRSYLNGPHAALAQRLLKEIAAASNCLLDPARKAAYDAAFLTAAAIPSRPDVLPPAPKFAAIPNSSANFPPPYSPRPPPAHPSESLAPAESTSVPLALKTTAAVPRGGTAQTVRRRDSAAMQFVKIVGGGALGLGMGWLVVYWLSGNDMLGILPKKTTPTVVATLPSALPVEVPETPASLERDPRPEAQPAETKTTNAPPAELSKPAELLTTTPIITPPPAVSSSPPPVTERAEVLSGVPEAWQLPEAHSPEPKIVATFAREPDEPLVLTLRSDAARLTPKASLAAEPAADGRSWIIQEVTEGEPPAKTAWAAIRRDGTELKFSWVTQADAEIRGQLANCRLELRHGASSRSVQLRRSRAVEQVLLDMNEDKKTLELSVADFPRVEKVRLDIRELIGFPTGAALRGGLMQLTIGKQAVIEFTSMQGAEIGLKLERTLPAGQLVLRLEPVFRENRLKYPLTFNQLERTKGGAEMALAKATQGLSAVQAYQQQARSLVQQLESNRPSADDLQARAIWAPQYKAAVSNLAGALDRAADLQRQIQECNVRLANVPEIRSFLDSLHGKAAIRFVISAECGERDIVLVDGTSPVVAAAEN